MVKILVYTSWCTQNVRSKYLCIHHDIHRMRCQKYLWNNMMFTDCVVNISVCTSWCTQNVWSKWLCICHDVHRICGQNTCVCIMRFTNILSKYLCIYNNSHRICGQNTCVYVMMSTECVVKVPVSDVHRMCGQIPVYTMWYSQNVLSKYLFLMWCSQNMLSKCLCIVEFNIVMYTVSAMKILVFGWVLGHVVHRLCGQGTGGQEGCHGNTGARDVGQVRQCRTSAVWTEHLQSCWSVILLIELVPGIVLLLTM